MAALAAWGIIGGLFALLMLIFYLLPKWAWRKIKSIRETAFLRGYFFDPMFSNTKYKIKYSKTFRRYIV